MTHTDDYWQDRLTEQEIEYERRLEKLGDKLAVLREALEMAQLYVDGEGTDVEREQVRAALRIAI